MADKINNTKYTPKPIDTSHICLLPDLDPLIERLAENNHDEWALGRINDGWLWGPKRSDDKLHHPCLVEYNELPEKEKEYDRNSVISTLKLILAMGYKITKDTYR